MPEKEKRIFPRKHLIYYLKVMEQGSDDPVGFMVDITTEGIMIMSEAPFTPDRIHHFRILLQTDTGRKEYLNFDAKSKWCKKADAADFYDTGFELLNVAPESFSKIEHILETLCFKD